MGALPLQPGALPTLKRRVGKGEVAVGGHGGDRRVEVMRERGSQAGLV